MMRKGLQKKVHAALAAAFVVCAAAPLGALTVIIPSTCQVENATGQVFIADSRGVPRSDVFESVVGEGVVMWDFTTSDGRDASVLRICRSGRELRVIHNPSNANNAYDRLTDMAFGEEAYTLPQIDREMSAMGSETHRTRNTYGSCVCDALGY